MELQKALEEYEKYFGERYFFYIGFEKTDSEIISEIQKCIRTGKKQRPPKYRDDCIYWYGGVATHMPPAESVLRKRRQTRNTELIENTVFSSLSADAQKRTYLLNTELFSGYDKRCMWRR